MADDANTSKAVKPAWMGKREPDVVRAIGQTPFEDPEILHERLRRECPVALVHSHRTMGEYDGWMVTRYEDIVAVAADTETFGRSWAILARTVAALAGTWLALTTGQAACWAATAYPGGTWEPGAPRYGVQFVDAPSVTLDDGVVLKARVAYPTDLATGARASGKFPVALEFSEASDPTSGGPIPPASFLVQRGYIAVVVAPRAAAGSQGEMQFYSAREGRDGKEIVEWASRLEGADGRVGMFGCSYAAALALTTAAHVGPNSPLKAVVPACIGPSGIQRESFMVGGMPTTGTTMSTRIGNAMSTTSAEQFFDKLISDIQAGGEAAYDREFWRERIPLNSVQQIADNGIAVLLWSGWRDYFEVGALRGYAAFQNRYAHRPPLAPMDPRQPVTPRYQIIVDNLTHGANIDMGIILQWLDTWVKGVDTGIGKTTTPIHLFEAGDGRWVNLSHYPVVSRYTVWRLGGGGRLTAAPPRAAGRAILNWGPPDQVGSKLAFTSAPLTNGATLSGPMSATVYASSTKTNLVLIARAYDVAPDGQQSLITKGAVVGSLRSIDREMSWTDARGTIIEPWPTLAKDEYLTPGKPYRLDIALAPRQWGLAPGHRLRLELTTQNSKETCNVRGTDPCGLTKPQQETASAGTYTVLYGPQSPSSLNLPLLPWHEFRAVRAATLPTRMVGNNRAEVGPGVATLPLDWGPAQ